MIGGVFEPSLESSIKNSKVLMVGAGGIGCELLKNLVLTGFQNIEIIDLDTIDVSNLNRQFLFQKEHVGKSKSNVAKESALRFNPDATIKSYHDSIMNCDYGVSFYKNFNLVLNALDNRAARNHVNRMCLASNVPLIESGTAGYLGQVTVIQKGITECYECSPKASQKTYPGCTIRNTPSEPIHSIVWAKHLFNQLFGEGDADEDVSPDAEDPEAGGTIQNGNITRLSTRLWALNTDYNPHKIFNKLFNEDIKYLLTMDKLWTTRRPPTPLDWTTLPENEENKADCEFPDQRLWTLKECAHAFEKSIIALKDKYKALNPSDHFLVWDKDDEASMDFVTACSNIRSFIFGIPTKSRFDVKSMAGNIIPAIATTNAIIAGCIVMEALRILDNNIQNCKTVYLTRKPNPSQKILVPIELSKPNPKCYVCSDKPVVSIKLNLKKMTLKFFEEAVLKGALGMIAPDAEIEGRGVILISSEEGETESNTRQVLSSFGLLDDSILSVDDFMQELNLKVFLLHSETLEEEFEVFGDVPTQKKTDETTVSQVAGPSCRESEENDVLLIENTTPEITHKRKSTSTNDEGSKSKKSKRDLSP